MVHIESNDIVKGFGRQEVVIALAGSHLAVEADPLRGFWRSQPMVRPPILIRPPFR